MAVWQYGLGHCCLGPSPRLIYTTPSPSAIGRASASACLGLVVRLQAVATLGNSTRSAWGSTNADPAPIRDPVPLRAHPPPNNSLLLLIHQHDELEVQGRWVTLTPIKILCPGEEADADQAALPVCSSTKSATSHARSATAVHAWQSRVTTTLDSGGSTALGCTAVHGGALGGVCRRRL